MTNDVLSWNASGDSLVLLGIATPVSGEETQDDAAAGKSQVKNLVDDAGLNLLYYFGSASSSQACSVL
jgi:hypothetical protein